jgi:phage replication-related protein YjqB (UPF0714/DUF867 family)
MDKYSNYAELEAHEREGIDFEVIVLEQKKSLAAIIAPHAGGIEPKTGLIVRSIARTDYSFYCFRGLKSKCNPDLHIASHRFDEPRCLKLIANHKRVVSIHGCDVEGERVFLGGLDNSLIEILLSELSRVGITVEPSDPKYSGTHPNNICNRGQTKRGVQLELSIQFRIGTQVPLLVNAVRRVLHRLNTTDKLSN